MPPVSDLMKMGFNPAIGATTTTTVSSTAVELDLAPATFSESKGTLLLAIQARDAPIYLGPQGASGSVALGSPDADNLLLDTGETTYVVVNDDGAADGYLMAKRSTSTDAVAAITVVGRATP